MDDAEGLHLQAFCETGYWGRAGAGCLVYALSTGRLLFPMRSDHVLEPRTWGTWGGAVDPDEDLVAAAIRELCEEAGLSPDAVLDVVPSYRFADPGAGFFYQNFLVVVADEFEPVLNWESSGSLWARPESLQGRKHPGLDAFLCSELARAQLLDLDARRDADLQGSMNGPGM